MSPVRQAAHWICSVLIFKANHWEFGSPMLLRHTHVASWQVIFEKTLQVYQCPNFSNAPFLVAFFQTFEFCQQNTGCPVPSGKMQRPPCVFFERRSGETQLRRGGGTGGTWWTGIVSAGSATGKNRKCTADGPYDRYKWSYKKGPL